MLRLHVGCGNRKLENFINIDITGNPDLQIDVRQGLPFPNESVSFIFAEHFIEHLTRDEGILFLKEAYRVLKPGGVCRIATPDLDTSIERYLKDSWKEADWIHRFHYEWIPNRCVMLNIAMREWGHQHVYNFEDLKIVGNLAGFLIVRRKTMGESDSSELRNLEYRPGSLVVEFVKESPEYQEELPLVSICIPAYNPRFFKEALQSALNQEYLNFEIIVSDDSNGEAIRKIITSFSDERIRYFKNPQNIGAWENYLRCLSYARGKYIKYLNDDDLLHPRCLKTMVGYFEAYGEQVSLVTSKRNRIDEKGQTLSDTIDTKPPIGVDSYIQGLELGNIVLASLLNIIGEPTTVMFRKKDGQDFEEQKKRFYDDQPGIGDVVMWLTLLSKGNAIYIAQPLSFFRQHPEQAQRNPQKIFYLVQSWYYLITRSSILGYLQEKALYQMALVNMVNMFQNWLRVFPFEESQKIKLHNLIKETQEENRRLGEFQSVSAQFQFHPVIRNVNLQGITPSQEVQYQTIQKLAEMGFIDEAIEALEAFTACFPDAAVAFNDLGVLYFRKGDIARALENLQECLKRDPYQIDALQNLRYIYAELGDVDKVKIYETILTDYLNQSKRASEN